MNASSIAAPCRAVVLLAILTGAGRAGGQSWTASAPPVMSLERGSRLPLRVASPNRVVGLHLSSVQLQDPTTLAMIHPDSVALASDGVTKCKPAIDYDPKSTRSPSLCLAEPRPGSYVGSVSIGADTGTPVNVPLTVHVSDEMHRLGGIGLLLLGIGLSWVVTVLIRRRTLQATVMIPAAQLRDRLEILRQRLNGAVELSKLNPPPTTPTLDAAMTRERGRLTPISLRAAGLPPVLTGIFDPNPAVPPTYTDHLKSVGERVAVLDLFVTGIEAAAASQNPIVDAARRRAAITAIDGCDPRGTLDAATAEACVKAKLDEMVAPPGAPQRAPQAAVDTALPPTRELHLLLRSLNVGGWLLWAFVTAAAGFFALVATNPGFGTLPDLAKCFFWGLGVQVAGQQLQQLAPSSAGSAIGVTLPKS